MKVMGYGAVYGLNIGRLKHGKVIVMGAQTGDILREPIQHGRIGVTGRDNPRLEVKVKQVAPTGCGTDELAPHQPTTDDAKVDNTLAHWSFSICKACCGVARS